MEEGRGGGQGSPLHAHDEYSPRVRATFVSQYVVSRERVVGRLIYSSNPLPDLPLLVPSSLARGATIPSLQLWKERGRRSEIAGVIYLLRSDFSSLHTSTTTFLASPIPTPEPTVIYDSSPLPSPSFHVIGRTNPRGCIPCIHTTRNEIYTCGGTNDFHIFCTSCVS